MAKFKKLIDSALNEVKTGVDKSGRANKKHILVISPAMEEYAVRYGAQKADYKEANPPICPKCKGGMNLKQGTNQNSKYWLCINNYCRGIQTYQPEWFYIGEVPIELEELVYKLPVVVDVQARAPQCPRCGGQMTWRIKGEFWGCMSYPKCKGSRSADAVLSSEDAALKQMNKPASKSSNKTSQTLISPEVVELINFAIVVLGSKPKAMNWLNTPKVYQLKGKSPWDVLFFEDGREIVRTLLETLRD